MIGLLMLMSLTQLAPTNSVDCDPHMVNGREVSHCAVEADAPREFTLRCIVPIDDCAMNCVNGGQPIYVAGKYEYDSNAGSYSKAGTFFCYEEK